MKVRPYQAQDAQAICEIYNHYILHTVITFEVEALTPQQMEQRIQGYACDYPFLVGLVQGEVVGYAYGSRYRARSAYQNTVETSIYLHHQQGGRGYGGQLYRALLETLAQQGYHTALGGVALPNEASERLHEGLGFHKVAHFAQVGHKFDQWIDVGFWQKML